MLFANPELLELIMGLWPCVFEPLLNQAVWENANLLSDGKLNSQTHPSIKYLLSAHRMPGLEDDGREKKKDRDSVFSVCADWSKIQTHLTIPCV